MGTLQLQTRTQYPPACCQCNYVIVSTELIQSRHNIAPGPEARERLTGDMG